MIPDDYCCPKCGTPLTWVGVFIDEKELACLNCGWDEDDDDDICTENFGNIHGA